MIRLSNSRRLDLIDILDESRGRIGDKSSVYICNAIHLSHGGQVNKDYLMLWIASMLEKKTYAGCSSLEQWLTHSGYLSSNWWCSKNMTNDRKVYRTRLAWIDWMRNELWRMK
jgi:hypothetical protein